MMRNYRIIVPFILLFTLSWWMPGCSSVNSVENVPRQVLLTSSEALMIEGRQITLSASLTRDIVPSSPEDGKPLITRVEIVASNSQNLPGGLETDAVWVMVDDQIWGSSYSGEQFKDDKTRIVKIAREGPTFGVGKKAVVIVRIHHDGATYLLKETGVEIKRTS